MKIAIIGTGISGRGAAWLLNKNGYDVTVFEQNPRAGGHANTITLDDGTAVDTGFIVYNEATYPNFIAFLDTLGVETCKTDMSFGVSIDNGSLEYSSNHLFAQKKNLLKPSYYKMIADIMRFYKQADEKMQRASDQLSLGDFLKQENYSESFIKNHILPMTAAIWSMTSEQAAAFPFKSFVRFFKNHGLLVLDTKARPQWFTVKNGSKSYVDKVLQILGDKVRLSKKAISIKQDKNGALVNDENFDQVILACHPDESLGIIESATPEQKEILSAFSY